MKTNFAPQAEGPDRTLRLTAVVVILLAGLFCLATIREGHDWGGDFSMYILQAKGLVEGLGFGDTGFILNPNYPRVPEFYPPVLPFFLAPVYALFGLNLVAMKAAIVLFFTAGLFMVYLTLKDRLAPGYLAALVAVVGFSPVFWEFKDQVLSDIPFFFFAYLTLYAAGRMARASTGTGSGKLSWAIVTGSAMYLAYGTRSVGVVLPASLLAWSLIRHRRFTAATVVSVGVFAALAAVQTLALSGSDGYMDIISLGPSMAVEFFTHLGSFVKKFAYLWKNGYTRLPVSILETIFLVTAVPGFVMAAKEDLSPCDVFAPFYLIFLSAYATITETTAIPRYILPLVPLYLFYSFRFISTTRFTTPRKAGMTAAALTSVIFISYIGMYTTKDFGPIQEGVAAEESRELFEFVKKQPEEAGFAFRKPRVRSLYTGRKATFYHEPEKDDDLLRFFSDSGIDHIIVSSGLDEDYFPRFVDRNREALELVYLNPGFKVYNISRIRSSGLPGNVMLSDTSGGKPDARAR